MPRSLQDIIEHAGGLAAQAERFDPTDEQLVYAAALSDLRHAVVARADAEQRIVDSVIDARRRGASWAHIGHVLGVAGESARQRYSRFLARPHSPGAEGSSGESERARSA